MTKIYRIPTGQVEGNGSNDTNTSEIRPYGEIAVYVGDNNKLELLMFDGVRTHVRSKVLNKGTFYGGDADGSEGLGYDTIKLVPDEALRRNGSNQYLIIDPTGGEPNHIHIRAGGAIDQSSTDLFLGGELNNVRVSDTNNNVTITTDFGLDGLTRSWTFDFNGDLTFPGSSNSRIGESEPGLVIYSDLGFAVVTNANTENSPGWIFGPDGNLSLPAGFIRSTQVTGLNLASNYDVHILADYTDNNHEWIFEASTAELTVPGAIKSKTNQQIGTQVANLPYNVGAGADNGYVGIGSEWNAVVALGDLTGYALTAQQTGSTIFTTTITQMRDNLGGQPAFQTADGLPGYAADITFTLTSPDYAPQTINDLELAAGNNTWTFGVNGVLTLPDNAKINVSIDNDISIETELLPTAPPTTIVISGADFSPVNLTYTKDPYDPNWFPAGYTPGSDPLIQYSDGQWKILVPGFDQALYVNTGTINVPLAQWNTNPPLGSVAPTGVYTYADTYTRTWQFGSNGNLTLPNNSTISDTPAVAQYSSSFKMSSYGYNGGLNGYFTASPDTNPYFNPLINTVTPGWFVSGPGLIGVKEITAMLEEAPNNWAITVDLTDGSTWPFDGRAYTFYSPDYQIVPAGSTLTVNSNEWKFGANGSLTFPDATVQTTAAVQGENLYPMDGTNTDITVTEVDFNLLVASTGGGYSGSATHNVNLPAGALGQRLVVVNTSNFITLTVDSTYQVTQASGPAEFIYTSGDGWISLYGTV